MSARRPRIYPYLHVELRNRLAKYCAATNATESAVVAEALERFLLGENDHALFLRRFDRLTAGQDRILHAIEVLSQAFGLFVRIWFAHTPRIPREARAHARRSAEARYRRLMDRLGTQVSGGKRFVDDVPSEPLPEEDEFAFLARPVGEPAEPDETSVTQEPFDHVEDESDLDAVDEIEVEVDDS